MKTWFTDPQELIKSEKVLDFWPTSDQLPSERINAASRFIIYATCVLYLTKRDPRVFVLGGTVLSILYVMYKAKMVKEYYSVDETECQLPTKENPMGNVLMTDYTDAPNRLQACYYPTVKPLMQNILDDRIPYDSGRSRSPLPQYQQNAADRQFITMPVSSIPGDQTGFAEWCYGKKNAPMCKGDPRQCSPDARGVQLEAFAGLDSSGDIRGQRGGGAVRSGSGSYA
jgi:hypothetical protein